MQYGKLMKDGKRYSTRNVGRGIFDTMPCSSSCRGTVPLRYSTWLSQAGSTSTVGYCTSTRIVQYLKAGEYIFCVSIIRVLALRYCELESLFSATFWLGINHWALHNI